MTVKPPLVGSPGAGKVDNMGAVDETGGPVLCSRCGDVIGVYEPVIFIAAGEPIRGSLLANTLPPESIAFHADCYLAIADGAE